MTRRRLVHLAGRRLGILEPTWEELYGQDTEAKAFDDFFVHDEDGEDFIDALVSSCAPAPWCSQAVAVASSGQAAPFSGSPAARARRRLDRLGGAVPATAAGGGCGPGRGLCQPPAAPRLRAGAPEASCAQAAGQQARAMVRIARKQCTGSWRFAVLIRTPAPWSLCVQDNANMGDLNMLMPQLNASGNMPAYAQVSGT